MTLYETIVQNSIEKPDLPAYHYFGYSRSHKQMLADVDETADALTAMGIMEGNRVGICLPNCPQLLNLLYAANKIGAVAVFLNPKSPADELYRQLHMTNCKILFFSSVAMEAVAGMKDREGVESLNLVCLSILEHMPLPIRFALIHRALKKPGLSALRRIYGRNIRSYREFRKAAPETIDNELTPDENREAVVIFSGGTNGTYKAVVHSSAGLYWSAVNCLKTEEPWPEVVSMLAILPAFHIFGLSVAIHLPLVADGCIELVPVFNLGIVTNIIKKECPAFFPGVPTIFERLLKYPRFARLAKKGKLNFSKFRHGFVGGDNLTDQVRDAFNELVRANGGDGYISMGYGMSECCPICVNNRTSHEKECIGIPFDTTKIRILQQDSEGIGEELCMPEGELGEIAIASSYLMLYGFDEEGHKNLPIVENIIETEQTAVKDTLETKYATGSDTLETEKAAGSDVANRPTAWLRTGDIGYLRDGKLFYRGRQRRIIKVSGNTIFADSIERVIEESVATVKKAYVVPVPHPTRGHISYAFVETSGEMDDMALLEVIQRACRNRLLPYAIPMGVMQIKAQDIPRTAIGKIAWGKLETLAAQRIHGKKTEA